MDRRIKNLLGQRFERLLVLSDSGKRGSDGQVYWTCQCDCGSIFEAHAGRMISGATRSCGCLHRELSSQRRKASRRPPKICCFPDCDTTTEKGSRGYCGKHAARINRYGDPNIVISEEERRRRSRKAQLARVGEVKSTTYRKFFGRHEHRVIGEQIAGRKLNSNEHVHHIDEDKHNNDPANLLVLTAAEHLRLHALKRSGQHD